MPIFDLRNKTAVYHNNQTIKKVYIGNNIVWKLAAQLPFGGVVTTAEIDGINYRIHTFTGSNGFDVYDDIEVEYFMVGGGGSGRSTKNTDPRGGGAGGMVAHNLGGTKLLLTAGNHTVTVGAGGAGGGNAGGTSSFAGITAFGGAGTRSGNGGSHLGSGGFVGGTADIYGGGGAGAGGDGFAGTDEFKGMGGPGLLLNPDGNPRVFGIGGSGNSGGMGFQDSDPDDKNGRGHGTPGRRVTGSSTTYPGGSGIVIIRYPLAVA